MSNIWKAFSKPKAEPYVFPDASEWRKQDDETPRIPPQEIEEAAPCNDVYQAEKPQTPMDFAQIQAEIILQDAHRQAEEILEKSRQKAQDDMKFIFEEAKQDGFRAGFAEGMTKAELEGRTQQARQAEQMQQQMTQFFRDVTRIQDEKLDEAVGDLTDLAMAVAEKVVRISLKNCREVIQRMIIAATEKRKRREWVHIYFSAVDAHCVTQVSATLTDSLASLSDHVRITPIVGDELGTCIIELPDEVIDASASTQLSNIRDSLTGMVKGSPKGLWSDRERSGYEAVSGYDTTGANGGSLPFNR